MFFKKIWEIKKRWTPPLHFTFPPEMFERNAFHWQTLKVFFPTKQWNNFQQTKHSIIRQKIWVQITDENVCPSSALAKRKDWIESQKFWLLESQVVSFTFFSTKLEKRTKRLRKTSFVLHYIVFAPPPLLLSKPFRLHSSLKNAWIRFLKINTPT